MFRSVLDHPQFFYIKEAHKNTDDIKTQTLIYEIFLMHILLTTFILSFPYMSFKTLVII